MQKKEAQTDMTSFITFFNDAVSFGTIIMFGCLGEIITEKSGHLNLGVPGIMYLGGISSLSGVFFYERFTDNPNKLICVLIALVCGFLASALGGLIFSFLTVTLRANQNVTGLALTIFGTGVANFFGGSLNSLAGGVGQIKVATTSAAFRQRIPFLSETGVFGKLFFSYGFMTFLAIALAIVISLYFNRTRFGLALRSVGENPGTADAAGINITRYKYLATCIGAGVSGLGGIYYVMDATKGTWTTDSTIETLGWIAVALVIFATWKSLNAIWGAYLFGILYWAYLYIEKFFPFINVSTDSQELFKMLPYLVTIAVLIITSLRNKKENQPPESLGLSYFREER